MRENGATPGNDLRGINIYLKERITECNLFMRMLPHRYGFSINDRIVLNSAVDEPVLFKMFDIVSDTDIAACIGDMLVTSFWQADNKLCANVLADFSTQKNINAENRVAIDMALTAPIEAVRTRWLYDMDYDTLAIYDNQSLYDVERVVY